MKIYILTNTLYNLLINLILIGNNNDRCFLLSDNIEDIIRQKISKKIYITEEGSRKIKNKFIKKIINLFLKIKIIVTYKKIILNKNKIVYMQDHLLYSILALNSKKYYLVEDGSLDYQRKKINKKINKIYLTGLAPIPKEIAHKTEIINLKELWNKKALEEQNEILDIFSFDLNIKEKIKGRDIILFTQPLSEDNVITEEEKLEIYLEIIKKYPKERLVIKTHPREKTNYKDIFKGYLVLDNPFPFEILNLLDIKFNKAITLFSTAALGLGEEVEVDFYGTEIHPKIVKRFGSCNNIMERNCFLKEE